MNLTKKRNKTDPKSLSLKKIAEYVAGEIIGDPDTPIAGVSGIKEAQAGEITFLSNSKYIQYLEKTKATAVIFSKDISCPVHTGIRVPNPSLAFSKVIQLFFESEGRAPVQGIHSRAVIDPDAVIGNGVSIGPNVVIEAGVTIGDGTIIESNSFVGSDSIIGSQTRIYPNVTVREKSIIGHRCIIHSGSVIGSDGFGYETIDGAHLKIPQLGYVHIEDEVEIGANVCVDRARFDKTWIKRGTKIDNLVQVAHNVVIGENCLIVSQAGVSGSTEIGNNVILAGQSGIVGHVKIGDRVIIGAQSGVTNHVSADTVVLGSPAKPIQEQKKLFVLTAKLPQLFKELSELKTRLFNQDSVTK